MPQLDDYYGKFVTINQPVYLDKLHPIDYEKRYEVAFKLLRTTWKMT